jgi:hypothetical protein
MLEIETENGSKNESKNKSKNENQIRIKKLKGE